MLGLEQYFNNAQKTYKNKLLSCVSSSSNHKEIRKRSWQTEQTAKILWNIGRFVHLILIYLPSPRASHKAEEGKFYRRYSNCNSMKIFHNTGFIFRIYISPGCFM